MLRKRLGSFVTFFDRWLPSSLLFRAPILLLGAASPFVADLVTYLVSLVAGIVGVVDWLAAYQRTLHLSISLVGVIVALAAVAHVVVKTVLLADSAAFAVMAKRFGQDYEPSPSLKALETNRLWGFLQLAADTFVVGCVLATAASSITYSVIHHVSLANPFSVQPTILHTLFFYFDHAIRGLLFDFCEWFRISFQKTLEIEHRLDAPFAYFLFGYRKLMSALTIQIVLLAATYAFFASKDERATVTEELQEAKTAAAAARNRVWQLQAEIQEKEGLEKARRFLKPRELGRYIRITELKAVGQYVEKRDYRWWRGIRERLGLPEEVYG